MPRTYNCIATTTLTSTSSSISFSNIPNTYTDLEMVYQIFDTGAYPYYRLNNYSAVSAYVYIYFGFSGNAVFNGCDNAAEGYVNINGGATEDYPMTGIIRIPNYTSSTNKIMLQTNGTILNTPSNQTESMFYGNSVNTSAVTSINWYVASGNLSTGTTISLYGILKG